MAERGTFNPWQGYASAPRQTPREVDFDALLSGRAGGVARAASPRPVGVSGSVPADVREQLLASAPPPEVRQERVRGEAMRGGVQRFFQNIGVAGDRAIASNANELGANLASFAGLAEHASKLRALAAARANRPYYEAPTTETNGIPLPAHEAYDADGTISVNALRALGGQPEYTTPEDVRQENLRRIEAAEAPSTRESAVQAEEQRKRAIIEAFSGVTVSPRDAVGILEYFSPQKVPTMEEGAQRDLLAMVEQFRASVPEGDTEAADRADMIDLLIRGEIAGVDSNSMMYLLNLLGQGSGE